VTSPEQAQPPWSAVLALQRAAHATVHTLTTQLAPLGLTPSEINALANLADRTSPTATELATATGTPATTLTSVLDRLERRGLARRRRAPADRRALRIDLTPAGQQAAATISHAITTLEQRALANLPTETAAGLRIALQALAEVTP
jgi:DNA-binding MarR family transcriptional regulator